MTDLADGYHWFRHEEDGSTLILLFERPYWYMAGFGSPIFDEAVRESMTYLRPVEPPPFN